ncbi:MAG: lysophospholipid acyltransferase family protein [Rikenellaceae bacterium]
MTKIVFQIAYRLVCVISLLPLGILLKLSYIFYLINWRVLNYRKSTIIYNLARSFPEKKYKEIDQIADKYSLHLCRTMTEWIKILTESESSLRSRICIKNEELLHKDQDRDLFLVMGHYGNWEMLNTVPMMDKRPLYAIYKNQASEISNLFSMKMRCRFGAKMLEMKEAPRFILTNKEPSIYVVLADQSPWVLSKRSLTFMHQTTLVFEGVERLARPKKGTVLYLEMLPNDEKGRTHQITLLPLDTSSEEDITTQFFAKLEASITANPQYWLWSHRRWKHSPQVEQKNPHK